MSEKPHLIITTPNFSRERGGVGASVERIAGYLRLKFNVTVLAPDKLLPSGQTREEIVTGLRILRFGPHGDGHQTSQLVADTVVAESRRISPCGVCGFYLGPIAYGAAVGSGFAGLPFLAAARGNDIDSDIFGPHAFQIFYCLRAARAVTCVSREMERKVRAWCPESKPVFVPNGVDAVRFPLLERSLEERRGSDRKPTVGLFGEIKAKKGLDMLLAAMDFNRYSLRIVGRLDEWAGKLLHGYLTLHPGADICIIPYVKTVADLLEEYRAVDVVCLPSLYDGMPNVLLEALSCGKVVVSSDVGGALDVIRHGENGFLAARGDPQSLSHALALAHRELTGSERTVPAAARRTAVEEFSWEREMDSYLDLVSREFATPPE